MKRILVVDDAAVDREVAGACVLEQGFQVEQASQGQDALEQIARDEPDLVLTDLFMPVLDGLELVKRIRRQYAKIPVILMTGRGTDDTAVRALQAGAASYIPKRLLKQHLGSTIRSVLAAAEAASEKQVFWSFLDYGESQYTLGYESQGRVTLIGHFEEELAKLDFCDAADRIRIGTALTEALSNAIEHGNLELNSSLRESSNYYELGHERQSQSPFRERRVRITYRVTPSEVAYVVADEGRGFDHKNLPDPTDPENLTRLSGRGLLLVRTFMDAVRFNEAGNEITMIKRRATNST